MKELMYKELKLSIQPIVYIFLGLSALLLIPNYPYYITFFYTCLGIFFVFQINRENHDLDYMMALPLRKRDMVKARFYLVVFIEFLQMLVCIPFAFIRGLFVPFNNQVGIEANVAFFGLSLIMMALFNYVFLTGFYKSGYKIGVPFVISTTVMFIYIVAAEILLRVIPYLRDYCDSFRLNDLIMQIPILLLGLVLFYAITVLAYHKSIKSFEQLDL